MQTNLGPVCGLYPMPATLVGALVDGRANFMAVAHIGILNNAPPQYLTVSLKKFRHTAKGIRQTGTFSIGLPSRSLVVPADYCGSSRAPGWTSRACSRCITGSSARRRSSWNARSTWNSSCTTSLICRP
jgi:flavin reductase (DIM6/NTAB) family NADH-FMN oxidoreductase RutF